MSDMSSRANRSAVWDYFEDLGSSAARCKRCNKVLKRPGSTTTTLRSHLRIHNISVDSNNNNAATPGTSQQQSMDLFVRKETVQEVFSKLVAVDGFSMHALVNSEFIQRAIKDRGFQVGKPGNIFNTFNIFNIFYLSFPIIIF